MDNAFTLGLAFGPLHRQAIQRFVNPLAIPFLSGSNEEPLPLTEHNGERPSDGESSSDSLLADLIRDLEQLELEQPVLIPPLRVRCYAYIFLLVLSRPLTYPSRTTKSVEALHGNMTTESQRMDWPFFGTSKR